jgi:hypothetical protein
MIRLGPHHISTLGEKKVEIPWPPPPKMGITPLKVHINAQNQGYYKDVDHKEFKARERVY